MSHPASGFRAKEQEAPPLGQLFQTPLTALGLTFPDSRELCSSDILEQLNSSAYNGERGNTERKGRGKEWEQRSVPLLVTFNLFPPPWPKPPHLESLNWRGLSTSLLHSTISSTMEFITMVILLNPSFLFYFSATIIIFPFSLSCAHWKPFLNQIPWATLWYTLFIPGTHCICKCLLTLG